MSEKNYDKVKGWQIAFEKPKPKFLQSLGYGGHTTEEEEKQKKRVTCPCLYIRNISLYLFLLKILTMIDRQHLQ
jgi:hypothetical protein